MKSEMLSLPVRKEEEIVEILRNDPVTSLIKKLFPSAFLVGGYIRDLFLGRVARDRDYVVTGSLDREKVKKISEALGGSFFIIKNMTRIIVKNYEIDITFTDEPLEKDLSKRDFSINSLAWSTEQGIIDLHNGLRDIKKRLIRAISRENLCSDPLRILRAYRLAAEIEGSIEQGTRKTLSELRTRLMIPAKERITQEIVKLLNSEQPDRYIKMAIEDKILQLILGVSNNNIKNNFKIYRKFNVFYKKNEIFLPPFPFSQGFTACGFLRLVCLSYKKRSWLLRLSRKNLRLIDAFHRVMRRFSTEILHDKKRLFGLFYEIKDLPEAMGFIFSSRRLLREAQRFRQVIDNPLIRGLDIARDREINSKHIGFLLKKLLALQYAGELKTEDDALRELQRFKRRLRA